MKTLKQHAAETVSESQSQQALIKWWSVQCRTWKLNESLLMAFPLQGARSLRNGARMKAEGMRRGTPDLFLAVKQGHVGNLWVPEPRHGLWIELKSAKGRPSPEQLAMLGLLNEQGFMVAICRSTDEAIQIITRYLIPT